MDYKYILFTLMTPQVEQVSEESLNNLFKQKLNAVSLTYPTHDGRAYAVFKKGQHLDNLDENLADCNKSITKMNLKLMRHNENNENSVVIKTLN